MAAARIVEALDVVENGLPGFRVRPPTAPIDQFAFERGKERLGQGIVEAVTNRAHRGRDTGLTAAPPEGQAGVLAAMVAVMDEARTRSTVPQGHLECSQHQ